MSTKLQRIECPVCTRLLCKAAARGTLELWCRKCKAARVVAVGQPERVLGFIPKGVLSFWPYVFPGLRPQKGN